MNTRTELLFEEFEKISKYDWLQKLKAELLAVKQSATETGAEPSPFYMPEDMDEKTAVAHRQFSNIAHKPLLIDEQINFNEDIISKIEKAAESGADGITLLVKKAFHPQDMQSISEAASFVNFINYNFSEGIEISSVLFAKNTGTLRIATKKAWPSNDTLHTLYGLLECNFPKYRFISISSAWHNCEDTATELAKTIALAIEYVHYYTERGLSLNHILNNIEFSFTVGKNFLTEIAKLRAARLLWNRVIEAYNIDTAEINIPIHCTVYPDNTASPENVIRLTIGAMAAVLGECDLITIIPFSNENIEFSERISRNIVLLLKEESYFHKVTDPLGGAFYIEKTTSIMAEKAWNRLRFIENKGGYLKNV